MDSLNETCPLCGSAITRTKFVQITRIREQEQKKLADTEADIRRTLEQKFLKDLQAQKQAVQKTVAEEAQKRVASITAERDRGFQKVKQLEDQQAALRKVADEEAQKRKALEEKYTQDLKAQTEAARKRAAEEAQKQLAVVTAERDRNLQKVKQLEEREAAIRKEATAEAERTAQKELAQERLILRQAQDTALLKKEGEFSRERESWQKKFQDMQRQLEQKTANQLGDGAELDLFETLREAFPDDRVTRVPKGRAGADIHHYVVHKGDTCGLIIYDSKNHQDWRDHFATKLRDDRIEAKAEYAILSTAAFPKGKKGLCAESDIIVVTPTLVAHVAALLRQALITMHVRGLSQKERAGKTNKLYQYITSGEYAQRLSHVSALAEELLGIDVQEQSAHGRVWKKRGELLIKQRDALREIDTQITAIIETDTDSNPLAPSPAEAMEKIMFSRN
jgi:hypothetical protein